MLTKRAHMFHDHQLSLHITVFKYVLKATIVLLKKTKANDL